MSQPITGLRPLRVACSCMMKTMTGWKDGAMTHHHQFWSPTLAASQ